MALIPKFMVVAAERAVAAGEEIKMGQIVSLNTSGEVVLQSSTNKIPYGVAGDTKSVSASAMPGIDSVNGWQNRVSDYYDETKASGKMTVYHSGGEFALDQFATNVATAAINTALYSRSGMFDTIDQDGGTSVTMFVGRLIQAAGTYPSGVPGVDLNGDQALSGDNSNTYIEVKLTI